MIPPTWTTDPLDELGVVVLDAKIGSDKKHGSLYRQHPKYSE
jgi:hypothetical protein